MLQITQIRLISSQCGVLPLILPLINPVNTLASFSCLQALTLVNNAVYRLLTHLLTPVNTCSPECYLSISLFLKNEVSVNACLQQISIDYQSTSIRKESCRASLKASS